MTGITGDHGRPDRRAATAVPARETVARAAYWLAGGSLTVALVLVGGVPVKVTALASMVTLVGLMGDRVLGPALALCLVLPEHGGAFPAVFSYSDVILLPMLLRLLVTGAWRPLVASPRAWALAALAVSGVVAACVGIALRGAGVKEVFFDAFPASTHLAAFALTATRRPASGERRLIGWIVAGAAVAALAGVAQVIAGHPVNRGLRAVLEPIGYPVYSDEAVHELVWWGVRKGFAAYFSPNGLGAAAMLGLLMAVALLARRAPGARRWTLAAAAATYAGLVATLSRGAALGAMAGLIAVAVTRARSGERGRAALAAGAAVALPVLQLALLLAPSPARTAPLARPALAAELKYVTASMKLEELSRTLSMFGHGAVLGAGYGALWTGTDFVIVPRATGLSPAYGEIVYRAGAVGAVAVVAVVAALLALSGAIARRARATGDDVWPLLWPALVGAAVTSLIDHPFLTVPGLSVVFWAAWGMVEARLRS